MLTRQGRKSDVNDNNEKEKVINQTLQDAGICYLGMSPIEKQNVYDALVKSHVTHVEQETRRINLSSSSLDCQRSPVSSPSSNSYQKASTSQNKQEFEHSDDLPFPEGKRQVPNTNSAFIDDESQRKSGRLVQGAQSTPGRGRAIPKVKYNPLPFANPGHRHNCNSKPTLSPSSVQNQPSDFFSSPGLQDCPLSPQDNRDDSISNEAHSSQDNDSRQNLGPTIDQKCSFTYSESSPQAVKRELSSSFSEVSKEELNGISDEAVDVESEGFSEEESRHHATSGDAKLDSPASIEDAVEEDGKEVSELKLVGKQSCRVSPLEPMMRPMPTSSSLRFFEVLEEYRGKKTEWMARAKELAQAQRFAFLDKLLLDNPLWDPPIQDGGYNKQTLFKHSTPKFSKLFGNDRQVTLRSSDRTAKSVANSKIQAIACDSGVDPEQLGSKQKSKLNKEENWVEPEFHCLRAKTRQVNPGDVSEGRRIQLNNEWPSMEGSDVGAEDDVECVGGSARSEISENWQSDREQKKRLGDSDSEASPESVQITGSRDPFEFDEGDELEEIWKAVPNKNKKNNRRGGRSLQSDVEVETKSVSRPRGGQSQRGRSTKLRLQKGAIARPSEHATTSNKHFGMKGNPSEHGDGEIVSHNNVNAESRWIDASETRGSNNIPTSSFYGNNKVIQPRSPHATHLRSVKPSREAQRHSNFVATSGLSGNPQGLDSDRNEAAASERAQCPICSKMFLVVDIEAHCSGCVEYSSNAEGESSNLGNSERSDKTVAEVIEDSDFSSQSGSEGLSSLQCRMCKDYIDSEGFSAHQANCDTGANSQGRLKRASITVEDDGPVKKASRH